MVERDPFDTVRYPTGLDGISMKLPRATVTRRLNRLALTEIRDTSINDLAGGTKLEYKVLTVIPAPEAEVAGTAPPCFHETFQGNKKKGYGLSIDDRQRREQRMT